MKTKRSILMCAIAFMFGSMVHGSVAVKTSPSDISRNDAWTGDVIPVSDIAVFGIEGGMYTANNDVTL